MSKTDYITFMNSDWLGLNRGIRIMDKLFDKVITVSEAAFIGTMILFAMYVAAALGVIIYSLTQ